MSPLHIESLDEVPEGTELQPLEIHFSEARNRAYCDLVNEINPLHFDQAYARSLGYRDIVIAGIFTASFFPKVITDRIGSRVRIERIRVTFKAPAYLDDTVTYRGRLAKKSTVGTLNRFEFELTAENADGDLLASATILLGQ